MADRTNMLNVGGMEGPLAQPGGPYGMAAYYPGTVAQHQPPPSHWHWPPPAHPVPACCDPTPAWTYYPAVQACCWGSAAPPCCSSAVPYAPYYAPLPPHHGYPYPFAGPVYGYPQQQLPREESDGEEEEDESEEEEEGADEMEDGGAPMEQEEEGEAIAGEEEEEAERTPFYVLSEEAIALFARSDERRRKEKNRRRKEQAKAREEAKKERYARKTGTFVTLSTLGNGEADGASAERAERARLLGSKGLEKIEELEGMLSTIYNRACDLKQPVVWPSMPLRLGA